MAKKKDGTASFQIEIRSEPQWRQLCRKDGLIVIDVYPGWTGPCVSIVNFLKRVKSEISQRHETVGNKLTFATACSDKIEDLLMFKDRSEPTWLFLAGGGKPVKIFKGCHVPNLAKAIYDEFERELLVIEGKARRNVVLGVASVKIDDDAARKLYRIPYEVEEATQEDQRKSVDVDPTANADSEKSASAGTPKKKIPVVLPPGVLGETTFLLLESTEIKNILESGGKPSGALQTADDWLRRKVGPRLFEQALEHSPNSLHATYGKGQYMSGVWCPRRYDDKRHILLTYFPQFLIEKVLPFEVGEEYTPKRYALFVFPATKSKDITETIKSNEADVFAQGRSKITPSLAEKMAKSWELSDDETEQIKQKLTSGNLFCVSINRRNDALLHTLQGLATPPIHYSVNAVTGASETAGVFPNLNAKYEEDADEVLQKFAARAKPRVKGYDEPEEVEPEPEQEGATKDSGESQTTQSKPGLSQESKADIE